MHSYFIDTSALFKRYVEEQGSEVVDSIFSESAEKHISTISILELLSNLQRLHLIDKIMSSSQFTAAWTAFSLDLADGTLQTVNAAAQVINRAVDCLQACYVTPIDALQLASAESLGDVILVSSDRKLSRLALEKGMRVTDPCVEP
ncbi:MAG: type II toxin-antitoxin system VapC family toxin [Bacillota bacterium]|jgi:predicted nucleic acid-binding protein